MADLTVYDKENKEKVPQYFEDLKVGVPALARQIYFTVLLLHYQSVHVGFPRDNDVAFTTGGYHHVHQREAQGVGSFARVVKNVASPCCAM
eukprot:744365-Prorocentrum_minimum.AAC.1